MQTPAATPVAIPAANAASKIGIFGRLSQAMIIRRERRALLALDDRMLADVGLSRADAHREAYRSLLDVPVSMTHMTGR